ncbi:MAG: hypothetical protein OCD01_15740 [Fibrobacterales bacterium]
MMDQAVALQTMLREQLAKFKQVSAINSALLKILSVGTDLDGFTQKLQEKNTLLDGIQASSQSAAPLISEWMQVRDAMKGTPEFTTVEQLLSQIEVVVEKMKQLDEEMVAIFNQHLGNDKPQSANDIINAYRAMR